MKRVLFAAGGTMGHLGPALAVASSLRSSDPSIEIVFVGTRSGIESTMAQLREHPDQSQGNGSEFRLRFITRAPLPRRFGLDLLLFPFRFILALFQSIPLVGKSEIVVGFGGYVATPIYLAAKLLRRRIVLHEANALPGFANRAGKALGAECFANFESIGTLWNCPVIGMPLRPEIIEAARRARSATVDGSQRRGASELLVIGGSQGSMRINSAIWSALDQLEPELIVRHAVGSQNLSNVPRTLSHNHYHALGFIEDMASAYESADLVIARAGAVTCAELLELGKRAILVPLGHGNGEQSINAQALVSRGNAISVADSEFDGAWLTQNIARAFALQPTLPDRPHLDATSILTEAILREKR